MSKSEKPRQPLFPFRYETWKNKKTRRKCAVISYDEDTGFVEYMYFKTSVVYTTTKERWLQKFTFVTSP